MKRLQIQIIFGVLSILFFGLNNCDHSESLDASRINSDTNPVLLISIDGFMNEYLERNETPNFDSFLENGVQAEYLIPVFPSNTFPAHWSIVTGLYVENHGIIANSFYDHELEGYFSYGPPENSPNDERWWGGEPIWVTAEKQDKTAGTFFWPGSEASINGVHSTKWVDYDGSIPERTRIDSVISWLDPSGNVQADFGTLYFSFLDSRGHRFGPGSKEVDEAVVEMDGILGYLLAKIEEAGLAENLNVILVSDHGMASTTAEDVIFLEDLINLDDVEIISWTPVGMLKPSEGLTESVYQSLKTNEENYSYSVYLKDEMPDRFHFSSHYRIPEIIMIADVGFTITSRPFFEERGVVAGTHGYDNMAPEMRTFFAASGPDFKSGEMVPAFESVHIYELLTYLLQIEPAINDGDLDQIRYLFRTN